MLWRPHKYSNTLFCKALLADIELRLDVLFSPPRYFDPRSIGKDDEFVVVADAHDMVEVDEV